MKSFVYISFGILGLAMASASQAVSFSWTGASNVSGDMLTATANFTAVGNVLTIVLSNDSVNPSDNPADTLGTLVWNMTNVFNQPDAGNNVSLGSSVVEQNNAAYTDPYDLNKEYMYEDAFTFVGTNFDHGVSSVGLGVFGTNDDTFHERMKGLGNAGSSMADAFSIASPGGTEGAANNFPVVRNAVTFTLVSDTVIDLESIGNVGFSFGSGAQTNSVPEPATMTILGLGALAAMRRRRKA